jgi:predicted kinase
MITFIVGLPGSGKSCLGKEMINENTVFLDDISILGIDAVVKNKDKDLVISDVYLCLDNERTKAVNVINKLIPNCKINWIYFENNPGQCLKNVERRKKDGDVRKVEELIRLLSKDYKPQENIRKVWCDHETKK